MPIHFSSLIPKISIFNLAISCSTMFNLPWFMDLTFQIPMQYCSLQHQTLLSPPDTSTSECHFCFGLTALFFLELLVIVLQFHPVVYWTPSNLGGSSSGIIPFCLFILFMGFHGKNTGVCCYFLFQWTVFYQNASLWHICLVWPYSAGARK